MNEIELAARCERLETELSEANRKLAAYSGDTSLCYSCSLKIFYEKCPECNRLNNAIIHKLEEYIETLKEECKQAQDIAREAIRIHQDFKKTVDQSLLSA